MPGAQAHSKRHSLGAQGMRALCPAGETSLLRVEGKWLWEMFRFTRAHGPPGGAHE